jgi:hypothetical protein
MILSIVTFLLAWLKSPGIVVLPRLETLFSGGMPARQTTGHVSFNDSFDFKAVHLKHFSSATNFEFGANTLPSPKVSDPSELSRRQPERSMIQPTPDIAAVDSENHRHTENDTSGPIEEHQLATGDVVHHSGSEDEESVAIEELDQEQIEDSPEVIQSELPKEDHPSRLTTEIVVETRYCVICNHEQPLRAKHCKDCGKCIFLHDHHCPWLGNCIGERNRLVFFWYLVVQTAELWAALMITTLNIESSDDVKSWLALNSLRLGVLGVLLFFSGMVTMLLWFHCYLAVTNKTTCKL